MQGGLSGAEERFCGLFSIQQPLQHWSLPASLTGADVAIKSFKFRVVAVYVPNSIGDRRSFFRGWGHSSMIQNG